MIVNYIEKHWKSPKSISIKFIGKKSKILILSLSIAGNIYQHKNACEIFKKNLLIIKDRIERKKGQDVGEVNQAIIFLEQVTNIQSHSNGTFIGRLYPTKEDYTNWLNWFKINQSNLYWDDKEQKVKVKTS